MNVIKTDIEGVLIGEEFFRKYSVNAVLCA